MATACGDDDGGPGAPVFPPDAGEAPDFRGELRSPGEILAAPQGAIPRNAVPPGVVEGEFPLALPQLPPAEGDLFCLGTRPPPARGEMRVMRIQATYVGFGPDDYLQVAAAPDVQVALFPGDGVNPSETQRTDGFGALDIPLTMTGDRGWQGRLRLRAVEEGFLDTWLHFPGGWVGELVHAFLVRVDSAEGLARVLGATLDGERGTVLAGFHDCNGGDVAHAVFVVDGDDAQTRWLYIGDSPPPAGHPRTTHQGSLMLSGMPAGRARFRLVARPLGSAEARIIGDATVRLSPGAFDVVVFTAR